MLRIVQDLEDAAIAVEVDEVVVVVASPVVGRKTVLYLVANGELIVFLDEMSLVGILWATDLCLLHL